MSKVASEKLYTKIGPWRLCAWRCWEECDGRRMITFEVYREDVVDLIAEGVDTDTHAMFSVPEGMVKYKTAQYSIMGNSILTEVVALVLHDYVHGMLSDTAHVTCGEVTTYNESLRRQLGIK